MKTGRHQPAVGDGVKGEWERIFFGLPTTFKFFWLANPHVSATSRCSSVTASFQCGGRAFGPGHFLAQGFEIGLGHYLAQGLKLQQLLLEIAIEEDSLA
jgi:hypothetical protein